MKKKLLFLCLAVLVFSSLAAAVDDRCTDTLNCYFNNQTSSPVIDYQGSNDLPWNGSPQSIDGYAKDTGIWGENKSLDFNKDGNDDFLEAPSTALDDDSTFSVSWWMTYRNTDSNEHRWLSTTDSTFSSDTYSIRWTNNQLNYCAANCDGETTNLTTAPDGWFMVTLVVDGSEPGTKLYINTSLRGTGSEAVAPETGIWWMGPYDQNDADPATWSAYTNGSLDEIKVFDKALNSTEISNLYQTNNINNQTTGENPIIHSTRTKPPVGSWEIGTPVNISEVNATDPDGNLQGVNYSVWNGSNQFIDNQRLTNISKAPELFQLNNTFTPTQQATPYTLSIRAFDNDSNTAVSNITRSIGNPPNITINRPQNTTLDSFVVPYNITVQDDNDSIPNEAVSVELFNDTQSFRTVALNESDPDNRTATGVMIQQPSSGLHNFTAKATQDGATDFESRFYRIKVNTSFTVQDEKTENFIPANITVSNGTHIKEFTSHRRIPLPTQNGNNVKVDVQGQNVTMEQVRVLGEVENNGVTATFSVNQITFIDGTVENNPSCSISVSGDVGDPVDDTCTTGETKIVESFTYSSSELDGGANDAGTVILQQRGKITGDISSLALNASLPTGNLTVLTSNSVYRPRTYFTTTQNEINLAMYLLAGGEGLFVDVEVQDPDGNTIEGALINMQRKFGLNFQTVSQETTSTAGTASFYLDPDVQYNAVVSKTGFNTFSGTFSPASYEFDTLVIQLGRDQLFNFSTVWDSISYDLNPDKNVLRPNASRLKEFNFTVSDSDSSLGDWGLEIRNETGQIVNSTTVSGSPSGGTATLFHNLSIVGSEVTATGFFNKNGTRYNVSKTYIVRAAPGQGPFSLRTAMDTFEQEAGPGVLFFIAVIVTLMIGTFSATQFGGTGGSVATVTTLGVFSYANWIPRFAFIITLLAVAAAYMLQRS